MLKVRIDINEGIASVVECPEGVEVEIRDYDTEGTDFRGMKKGVDYDVDGNGLKYLIGG